MRLPYGQALCLMILCSASFAGGTDASHGSAGGGSAGELAPSARVQPAPRAPVRPPVEVTALGPGHLVPAKTASRSLSARLSVPIGLPPVDASGGQFFTLDVPGAVATVCNSIVDAEAFQVLATAGHFTTPDGEVFGWLFDYSFYSVGVLGASFTSVNHTFVDAFLGTFDTSENLGVGCLSPGSGPCRSFGFSYEIGFQEQFLPPQFGTDDVFFRSCCGASTFPDGIVRGHASVPALIVVHPPGAVYSYARGSGSRGGASQGVVGRYDTADGVTHGYLRTVSGQYETIDVPDAIATIANDGSSGPIQTIVGEFVDQDGVTHGFVLTDGTFEGVDFPDAVHTAVKSTTNTQSFGLCGSYIDADGNEHGFVFRR